MWILPIDADELGASLPDGVHMLPGYYGKEEREVLLQLLRGAVPKTTRTFVLDGHMADEALRRGARFPDALVLVHEVEESGNARGRVAALEAFDARYLLVQSYRGKEATAWLEGVFKVPLMRWLRQELRRPDHPLAGFGVSSLNVLEAAARTTDPVRFIDMMAGAIEHRVKYARVGTERTDWARSLDVGAFSARLQRIERRGLAEAALAEKMPHQRLLHVARETVWIEVDTRWECGWEPTKIISGDGGAFYASRSFARELRTITMSRLDELSVADWTLGARRERSARLLVRVHVQQRSEKRKESEWATFVGKVLEFFSSSLSEMLANSEQTLAWVRAWARRKRLATWRRHSVGNVAVALAHALLRARRSAQDVSVARELLDRADQLSGASTGPTTKELRVCAAFVGGEDVFDWDQLIVSPKLSALVAVLREVASATSITTELPERLSSRLRFGQHRKWQRIANPSKPRIFSRPSLYGVSRGRGSTEGVTTAIEYVASYNLDEAIGQANAVLAGSDDDVMPIERAFAREIIGTAQALRGDVDAAIEAFSIARETYAALEDTFRILNIDEQIAALRAAG